MDRAAVKQAIMDGVSAEIDLWLDKQGDLSSGHEYEEAFIKAMQRVNKLVLEKTLATPAGGSRNGKKKS